MHLQVRLSRHLSQRRAQRDIPRMATDFTGDDITLGTSEFRSEFRGDLRLCVVAFTGRTALFGNFPNLFSAWSRGPSIMTSKAISLWDSILKFSSGNYILWLGVISGGNLINNGENSFTNN
jgi:hypothetical protein